MAALRYTLASSLFPSRARAVSRRVAVAAALVPTLALTSLPAQAGEKVSVLGLEGNDKALNTKLTDALQKEFASRSFTTGQSMPLLELRFSVGCEENDDPCIAQGGKSLGSESIVYGTLTPTPSGIMLRLRYATTSPATIKGSVDRTVEASALSDANIGATVKSLTDELLGVKQPAPEVTPTPDTTSDTSEPGEDPRPEGPANNDTKPSSGKLVWGKDPHPPAWKWAGLGVSAGLTVAGLGAALGTGLQVRNNGPVYNDLIKKADASLADADANNNVDRNTSGDICSTAREGVSGNPGGVRNQSVVDVCDRGEKLATVSTAMWVVTGVMAVSTITFTTLLFVHRKDSRAARTLRSRDVAFGGMATSNFAMVAGRFRF